MPPFPGTLHGFRKNVLGFLETVHGFSKRMQGFLGTMQGFPKTESLSRPF
jgi:hypothetical protein